MTQRVALVTGCGKRVGIGSASARALAGAGFDVVVADIALGGTGNDRDRPQDDDRTWNGLESLVVELRATGRQASWLQGDISSEDDARRLVSETVARHGRLDALVNNAGAPHGDDRVDIAELSLAAWERVMSVNARGTFLMSREAVPTMRKQRYGRIVNVASAIVRFPLRSRAAYITSKAAVVGFTTALALDVADAGITVNAVCPGSVRTSRALSSTRAAGFTDIEAGLAARAKGIPMNRHADPDEIAATVAFLCSDAAAYITGHSLYIDGGGLPRADN
jgi:3-oxoacyl-[acyl-carrier protein] reductase